MKIHTSNEAFILKVVYEVSIFISETSSISSSSQILLSYVKMYMFICNRVRINDYNHQKVDCFIHLYDKTTNIMLTLI